jgi:hypothetical protein
LAGGIDADLQAAGITTIERIAGADRYETSYLLAQRAIELGGAPFNTWAVTGGDFADALSSGPAVASTGGVMIMVDGQDLERSPGAVQYFTDLRYTAPLVTYVGGFAAISQLVEEQVFGVLIGQGDQGGDPDGGSGGSGGEPAPTSDPGGEPEG